MKRKRKMNLPLIEVIIVSLVLHVGSLIVFGGISIYRSVSEDKANFEAPPTHDAEPVKKLQQQVRLLKKQKQSNRPIAKITFTQPSEMKLPAIKLDMQVAETRLSFNTNTMGGAGGRLGRFLDDKGLEMSASAVDFFGIRSQGERIMFVVDASKYILEDRKGGFAAYDIVKAEIGRMVTSLSPGTLFNVIFYAGSNTYAFSPNMLPATNESKMQFMAWSEPINKSSRDIGVKNNIEPKRKDIAPMEDKVSEWPRAVQIALEQNVDSIFVLTSQWQHHSKGLRGAEKESWLRKQGWSAEKDAQWKRYEAEAYEWLDEENQWRENAGKPPRVVHWIGHIVKELHPKVKMKPDPKFEVKEVIKHVTNVSQAVYEALDRRRPAINVVLFQGRHESDENPDAQRFKSLAMKNRGKFRVLYGLEQLRNVTDRNTKLSQN